MFQFNVTNFNLHMLVVAQCYPETQGIASLPDAALVPLYGKTFILLNAPYPAEKEIHKWGIAIWRNPLLWLILMINCISRYTPLCLNYDFYDLFD